MLNFLLDTTEGAGGCDNAYVPIMIVVAVLLIAVMVIFPMITNRKQKKAVEQQRGNLSVGDTIETVGGIIGVVKEIREPAPGRKELLIETGSADSATTLVVDVQALYMVLNRVGGAPAVTQTAPAGESRENIKLNEQAESASVDPFENSAEAAETTVETVEPEDAAASAETTETVSVEEPQAEPAKKNTGSRNKKTK